jgi:hypothetical protein
MGLVNIWSVGEYSQKPNFIFYEKAKMQAVASRNQEDKIKVLSEKF